MAAPCAEWYIALEPRSSVVSSALWRFFDPFHMDHFKVGRTWVRPTLQLSHAPANRVETSLDNRVRPTSEVGFDPVVSELEVS